MRFLPTSAFPAQRCNWTTRDALKEQAAICKEDLTRSSPTAVHDVISWNIYPLRQNSAFQGGSLTGEIRKAVPGQGPSTHGGLTRWQVGAPPHGERPSKCAAASVAEKPPDAEFLMLNMMKLLLVSAGSDRLLKFCELGGIRIKTKQELCLFKAGSVFFLLQIV